MRAAVYSLVALLSQTRAACGVGVGGLCVCQEGSWLVWLDDVLFQARYRTYSSPSPEPFHPAGNLKKIGTGTHWIQRCWSSACLP